MRVYIINRSVTRNNIDDKSNHGYFMGYVATSVVIIYWNKYQPFVIHGSHLVWFDEYNYTISIEDNRTPGCLPLQQYFERNFRNSDLLNVFFIFTNHFINFIFFLMCLFLKGGQVCPVPPSLNSQGSCCRLDPLLMVVGGHCLLVSGE